MKTVDILQKQFTVLNSITGYNYHHGELCDYTQTIMTLKDIISLGYKYRAQIDVLRKMDYHSDEQLAFKHKFPCWFVGGTFPMNDTEDENIITYSNVLAIDIDKKDNKDIDIEDLKKRLIELPYVFMISKSISGKGIYVLVLLEDGKYTKEYYKYLVKLWKSTFNVNIDEQCKNIGRKRILSYDDDLIIKNDDVDISEWKLKLLPEIETQKQNNNMHAGFKQTSNSNSVELTRKAIWYLLDNGYSIDDIKTNNAYAVWYHVGCDFRHFDDGEAMFTKFSNNTSKYRDTHKKITAKWNNTKIENTVDDVCRKWCGICKNKYGVDWVKIVNQTFLF